MEVCLDTMEEQVGSVRKEVGLVREEVQREFERVQEDLQKIRAIKKNMAAILELLRQMRADSGESMRKRWWRKSSKDLPHRNPVAGGEGNWSVGVRDVNRSFGGERDRSVGVCDVDRS